MKEALYARIDAFLDEFPFVKRYVARHRFSKRPIVQRIDLDLLDRYGQTAAWTNRNQHPKMGNVRFLLIGADDEELSETRPHAVKKMRLFPQDITGETVGETIRSLKDPNQIKYILEVKDLWGGSRHIGDFDPDYGLEVVLYKTPSGMALSNWLIRIREIAANELRSELNKLNQV